MLRKLNVWYSVADGNFSDPAIWRSNGKKKYNYPQPGDDVYVDHVVTFDTAFPSMRNLYVSGTSVLGTLSSGILTINGALQVSGTFDATSTHNWNVVLNGVDNFIKTFLSGNNHTVTYSRQGDQDIMNLAYNNLVIDGSGYKNIFGTLTIGGTTLINEGNVVKRTAGKLTFSGELSSGSGKASFDNTINADLEFQNGFSVDERALIVNLGTGNLYLNGNQTLKIAGSNTPYYSSNNCLVMGSSVVTISGTDWNSPFVINGSMNGETAMATLNIDGAFAQGTPIEPMSTGIYNYNYGSNSYLGYVFDGDYELPYTSYKNLFINGTGIKTLSGNTMIDKDVWLFNAGTLELSSYDFTVTGSCTCGSGSLIKNGTSGYTKFLGLLNTDGSGGKFEFNSPSTLEFQSGTSIDLRSFTSLRIISGSLIKFTTRDQIFGIGAGVVTIDADILISGAITVTLNQTSFTANGVLNGDNASSQFIVPINEFIYKNAQQPMQTGILNCNFSTNTFEYGLSGSQDITTGTYRNLTLSGSGAKRLLGNVSVINTYILTSPATIDANGFTLTNP